MDTLTQYQDGLAKLGLMVRGGASAWAIMVQVRLIGMLGLELGLSQEQVSYQVRLAGTTGKTQLLSMYI